MVFHMLRPFVSAFIILSVTNYAVVTTTDVDPMADSIPYSIKWSGSVNSELPESLEDKVTVSMVTTRNERYECKYTEDGLSLGDHSNHHTYTGPSALDILTSFRTRVACSYRLESYWNYELCHNGKIRQFHEEKDPTKENGIIISQEYILGVFSKDHTLTEGEKVPTIQLDGTKYPYHLVHFTEGTVCDLTVTPRITSVYYICHEAGRGDIYEIKESSTCEYTAIIMIAELCNHPLYRPKKEPAKQILCYSLAESPVKPQAQLDMDKELLEATQTASSKSKTSATSADHSAAEEHRQPQRHAPLTDEIGQSEDERFIQQLLSGDYCLQGGSGWWLHEFCYGRYVHQFHLEGLKRVTNIILGHWNKDNHIKWLQKYPSKKPKPVANRMFISQYYSNGDFCEETKKPRAVEVRLKCVKVDAAHSSHSVAIYLLEPTTCDYLLTIESPTLCTVVHNADEYGLL